MSLAELEQSAFAEEPNGSTGTIEGIPIQSVAPYTDDTHFSNFYASHPDLATELWRETAAQILESDFDPRTAYLEGFAIGMAARSTDQAFEIPAQPGENTIGAPMEPEAEILMQLGATSLFLNATRAYYRRTRNLD